MFTAATTAKEAKDWSLPRVWVSIPSYKKQPVKKIWGRILGRAWLKFAVPPLQPCPFYYTPFFLFFRFGSTILIRK